ncbi:MAG: hypothetical protein SNG14_08225 [Rikenellaceae bacterium]
MKNNLKIVAATALVLTTALSTAAAAEATVSISPTTQRYFGTESKLDRSKFVRFHDVNTKEGDTEYAKLSRDYNFPGNYIGGRRFSYPIGKCKTGTIPKVKKTYSGVREVHDYIATTSAGSLFYDKSLNYAKTDFMPHIKSVSQYVAEALRDEWEYVPKYLEPFNEPMIHAADFCKTVKGAEKREAVESVITYICKYHNEVGKAVKSIPELKNVQMMGFGSAFPEFESNNFGLWNSRFKQFIDTVGTNIDILSFHLYDGSGVNNAGGRRSGSNIEAIMDMLQTYSFIKHGKPMPLAITEYGRLVPNNPEWEAQTGAKGNQHAEGGPKQKVTVSNYNPVTNSQAVRSQLHMVTAFMNRQNEIVYTVPFTIGKAPLTAMYCKSSLWVKQPDGSYEYSNRRFFFEMLKDLKGDNVAVKSSNVDIQTLALVDGKSLHVLLNNLYDEACDVKLDLAPAGDVTSVSIKTLKIFADKEPLCETKVYKKAPESINLMYGETAVVTYTYKKAVKFTDELVRTKYYSNDYLLPIKAGVKNSFKFSGVKSAKSGNAVLRLGVNRAHELVKEPTEVKINGTVVKITGDVVKGYNQEGRKQFFGSLEIPFDMSLIKSGDNVVEVSYAAAGGFTTTAILQLEQ